MKKTSTTNVDHRHVEIGKTSASPKWMGDKEGYALKVTKVISTVATIRITNLGKNVQEGLDHLRSCYEQDLNRLTFAPGWRRLVGKQQVHPPNEHPFGRNRMTHSLEVAAIGVSILRQNIYPLNLGKLIERALEDMMRFACRAHDIGHPPFGHNGEVALHKCMKAYGGFESNAQNFRLLNIIEKKKPDGLNVCIGSILSILKYPNVITDKAIGGRVGPVKGIYLEDAPLFESIYKAIGADGYAIIKDLICNVMDIADEIAYMTSDLGDGIKIRQIDPSSFVIIPPALKEHLKSKGIELHEIYRLFCIGMATPNEKQTLNQLFFIYQSATKDGLETVRGEELEKWLVQAEKLKSGKHRQHFTSNLIKYLIRGRNDELIIAREFKVLREFVYGILLNTTRSVLHERSSGKMVSKIFKNLYENNLLLPSDFGRKYMAVVRSIKWIAKDQKDCSLKELEYIADSSKEYEDLRPLARIICDFIACMTNEYAKSFAKGLTTCEVEPYMLL